MVKIYTKKGDSGTTTIIGGTQVSKGHPRVAAYGKIDELISWIAVLRSQAPSNDSQLRCIQIELMKIAAVLATNPQEKPSCEVLDSAVTALEESIDQMQESLPPLHSFILPCGPANAAYANVARTVCREAERMTVSLHIPQTYPTVSAYLNRLSDYLFTLARYLCVTANCKEDFWK